MKRFFLITNTLRDKDFALTKRIVSYIEAHGGSAGYLRQDGKEDGYRDALLSAIPKETECLLVIGGDGTLIKAARDTFGCGIPLIGLNLGTLGYLCELEEDTVFPALDQLFEGRDMIEERMMLTGKIERNGETLGEETALNDIVLHRSGSLHVVSFSVAVNGQFLSGYNADGIIVSTPTGSTAYSLSAGGPIVDPNASMLLLTPINSHNLNNRSIVFDDRSEITIELPNAPAGNETNTEISFDGTEGLSLSPGDKIRIRRAATNTKILKLSKKSFLEILQRKLATFT